MLIQPILHRPAFMYPWEKRTLFLGRLPEPVTAAYGAATLVISLGNPIDLKVGGRIIHSASFLVPAGVRVSINAGLQPVAIFHLDVLGEDFQRFQGCFRHQSRGMTVSHDVRDEADFHALLNQLYRQPGASAVTYRQLDGLLDYSFNRAGNPSRIDPLVQEAVDHIKQNYQDNIPVEELAQRVNVSTPTLIRKFKQQSGVPIRRFRLWHRIYESMLFISAGQNLTDAALSAGFSDSSHYTHTLQAMWGVSPSNLFARDIRAEIVPPQE
ncbi:MAG TPA: AraC family transcriptional regulator [Candidatus Kapabacteria bacterium]|nr:AraC family transcriptional regulator [Candidatus Kapabacteria bacterium]